MSKKIKCIICGVRVKNPDEANNPWPVRKLYNPDNTENLCCMMCYHRYVLPSRVMLSNVERDPNYTESDYNMTVDNMQKKTIQELDEALSSDSGLVQSCLAVHKLYNNAKKAYNN